MLDEMTWEQYREWNDYATMEPFGEERDDMRAGIVASSIVNTLVMINRDPKKGRPKLTVPGDFMPQFSVAYDKPARGATKKPLTDRGDWVRFTRVMAESYGAKVEA